MGIPVATNMICADSERRVFIAKSSQLYFLPDRDSSSWENSSIPGTPADLEAAGDSVYVLMAAASDCLYHFDRSSNIFVSDSVDITGYTPEFMDYSGGTLYICAENAGASREIYSFTGGSASQIYSVPLTSTATYFSVLSGIFYTGSGTTLYENDTVKGTGTGMNPYAVFSSSEIYAGALDANHVIKKLVSTTFTDVHTFSSISGVIKIARYKKGIIAVGISGSSADDGLYLYYTAEGEIKKISSRSIYDIFIR